MFSNILSQFYSLKPIDSLLKLSIQLEESTKYLPSELNSSLHNIFNVINHKDSIGSLFLASHYVQIIIVYSGVIQEMNTAKHGKY